MANTPEGLVKKRIKKILDQYGALHFSPQGTGYGVSGVSDIICLYKGRFIAIEAKADPKKLPTALQMKFLEKVAAWGGLGLVIHNENIQLLIDTMDILSEEE